MAEISRSALFGKLNKVAYKSIESAAVFCKMRGNPYVELVHWINQILQLDNTDLHLIIRHFNLNPSKLTADITASLDRLPRGSTSISDLSSHIDEAVERGWVYGSLVYKSTQVRTGHLIVGMVKTSTLRNSLLNISREFEKVKPEQLTDDFGAITSGSSEELLAPSEVEGGGAPGEASGAIAPAAMGKQEALAKFSVDLTARAKSGELDPIVGRDEEIRQVVDILMRRRQNNPILTGEAGVGKTAVVEGFAQRVAAGEVPPSLKDVSVRTLDIGLLQAGASMKGEFEQRLRSVIEEVQSSAKPIILFIDEAHTLIGAGGAAGTGDAANLLKPALARGTLRTIAATTWDEYKKHIEKDPALTRRFQVVKVEEPAEHKAVLMLRGLIAPLEKHHRVQILDEAIDAAVRLSHRYIPARQLPDKAVSLIDTAAARVAVSQHALPAELEDSKRRVEALEVELQIVNRETAVGLDHAQRIAEVRAQLESEKGRFADLDAKWKREKQLVDKILDIRHKLRSAAEPIENAAPPEQPASEKANDKPAAASKAKAPKKADDAAPVQSLTAAERDALLADLRQLQNELTTLQGELPLIFPTVDQQAVASVVADWTGIPVGRMVKNEIEQILKLADHLEKRVIGQRHGLEIIARRVQTSRAKLDNPNRPIGVFMLAGPSGVGKTETALALAETLYGGEHNLITINMSEFQEAHTVSTLKGSPPGYVGYGEGGVLTEAVRRRPYSVVLLDEVEKAHKDVHEIFFQVFDKGWMEDGEGRMIDFKNTIIILTTNAAQDMVVNMCKDPDLMPDAEGLEKALRGPLVKVFPDALLNRLVVVPYYPISPAMLKQIINLQLSRVQKRVRDTHKIPFEYDESVPKLIAERCTELERGARMVDAMITNVLLPRIGHEFLTRMMEGRQIDRIAVKADAGDFTFDFGGS
jgi:type VI secretion system protein VasG